LNFVWNKIFPPKIKFDNTNFEEYLKRECKPGEYMMMTIFVGGEKFGPLLRHLENFQQTGGIMDNKSKMGKVFGLDTKLEILDGDNNDKK